MTRSLAPLALVLAVFVAGCGGGSGDGESEAASGGPSVTKGAGNAQADPLPEGKPLAASFPADAVPLYEPFSIERATDGSVYGDTTMWHVSGFTHDDPKDVDAKMKAAFVAAGYEISEDKYTDDDGDVEGGFAASNDPIVVSVSFNSPADTYYLGIAYTVVKTEVS